MPPLDDLNPQQREAVEHQNGPLCVVAGPGTGKTRVLTCRIARLIKSGVDPSQIMAVTFTRKAAGELKRRLRRLVGIDNVYANTFHAFCRETLKHDFDIIGGDINFEVADESTQDEILADLPGCDKLKIQKYKLRDPNAVEADPAWLQQCYEPYESELRTRNMLDFADLLAKTVQLFEECPDLLARKREALHYIHVDEYQDTNYLQGKLAHMLAGSRGNICVVGDADQSIYGFQGAHPDNIRTFTTEQYPGAEIVTLSQNYRSTKKIVKASLAVIENNKNRIPKNLFTNNIEGGFIKIIRNSCNVTEAREIARTISSLHGPQYKYRDIAILFRSRWVADELKEKLRCRQIPFNMRRSSALGRRELLGDAGEGDDRDEVTLSTVHGAKGLEYKIVFMIGLEQGTFPDKRNSLEEERRLFYVGMTRAERLLYLSHVSRRGGRMRLPSIFLNEVPHALTR